ncbi:MAG: hypothetical protein ACRDE8_14740, partial [Ginsengibacter sp.]
GYYRITDEAQETTLTFTKYEKILFSGHIRNNSSIDNPITVFGNKHFKDFLEIISPYKNLKVLDKINRIIKFIGESSEFIGGSIIINTANDFTQFFCKNPSELSNFLFYLREQGITGNTSPLSRPSLPDEFPNSLTIKGWQSFENLMQKNIDSKIVFVAMNFKKEFDEIFDNAICPACTACDFEAIRADRVLYNGKICDRIIADIRRSRFIIADFTGQNNGVYYEAGFAEGLGLDVMKCCKKEEIDSNKLHFDTRQYNHISWSNIEDLKHQLIDRIKATVKPPLKSLSL